LKVTKQKSKKCVTVDRKHSKTLQGGHNFAVFTL